MPLGNGRAAIQRTGPSVSGAALPRLSLGTKPKGNFRLDSLTPDFSGKASREKWLKVLEQVKSGTMPPKEKPRPPAQEVKAVTDWISGRVEKAVSATVTQGRVVFADSTGPSTKTRFAICWVWTSI